MKRILLMTLLTASATATAGPWTGGPNPNQADRGDSDHGQRFDRWRERNDQNWVTLAVSYSAAKRQVSVPVRGRMFDRLRIESVQGSPMIEQIAVVYATGDIQQVTVGQQFPIGAGTVIRLRREPIRKMLIYSDPKYGGAYALHATEPRGNRGT